MSSVIAYSILLMILGTSSFLFLKRNIFLSFHSSHIMEEGRDIHKHLNRHPHLRRGHALSIPKMVWGKAADHSSLLVNQIKHLWAKGWLRRIWLVSSLSTSQRGHLLGPSYPNLLNLSAVRSLFWAASQEKKPTLGRQYLSQQSFKGSSVIGLINDLEMREYPSLELYYPLREPSQTILSSF